MKRLSKYAKPYYSIFLLAFIASIGAGAIDAGFLGLVKISFNNSYSSYHLNFNLIILILLVALITRSFLNVVSEVGVFRFGRSIVTSLRIDLYSQLVKIPIYIVEKHSTGELATKLIYHTEQLGSGFLQCLQCIIQEFIIVIAITCALFYINWRITLCTLIIYPVIGLIIKIATQYMTRHQSMMQDKLESIAHFLDETRQGIKTVCMQNISSELKSIYQKMVEENIDHQYKFNKASALSSAGSHMCASLPIVFLIWIMFAFPKYVTHGDIAAIVLGFSRLYQPIKRIGKINSSYETANIAGRSLFKWLDIKKERLNGKIITLQSTPDLKIKDVSVERDYKKIIEGVNINIPSKAVIAFAGESGSGKSSLLLAISGLLPLSNGDIFIDKDALSKINLSSWRNQIGYVDQELPIFNMTITENIAFFKPVDMKKIVKACYIASLDPNEFQGGFDQMIDYGGHNLSNGQKQRIVLARAIYHAKHLLIIDEATSALDQKTESKVYKRIKEELSHLTVILTSHRPAGLRYADVIHVISKGEVVESGNYDQLIENNQHFAKIMERKINAEIA